MLRNINLIPKGEKMKKILVLLMMFSAKMASADTPATHGMLLFGDKQTYASHLPMFHAPHDYQLIMEIEMVENFRPPTLENYKQAKMDGETLFTLLPQKMDLTQIIDGSKKNFVANIYAGHFEKGGNNLGPITVVVKKIVFTKKLTVNEPTSTYDHVLFGANGEYFAAHVIKGKPSSDAIYTVEQPAGLAVTPDCKERVCNPPFSKPFQDDMLPVFAKNKNLNMKTPSQTDDILGNFNTFAIVKSLIYFEENELSH